MAIKITNLEQLAESTKRFVYSDLHLDLSKNGNYSEDIQQQIETSDVTVDYDESAIRNSLRNLFNTKPGQRFLFPEYGLDLYQFVFEPISEQIGQLIGEKIVNAVETYEPRITVQNCYVECLEEENQYDIPLIIEFPTFNTISTINSILDMRDQSFIFVETSRNQ